MNGPRDGVVQAKQKAGDGSFAATRSSQKAQYFARLQAKGDVFQNGFLDRITKCDVIETNSQRPGR